MLNFGGGDAGAAEADEVETAGGDLETGVGEEGRGIEADACVAADDGQAADLAELVNQRAAGEEGLVLDFGVAGDEGAAGDDGAVADDGVMGDVAGGHDEVVVAD